MEKPSPLTEPAPKSPPEPAQFWTAAVEGGSSLHLQFSALKSRQAAARLGRRLQEEGFPVQVRAPEQDGLVRVLVGPVNDGEQLTTMANRLRKEGLKPFPRRL